MSATLILMLPLILVLWTVALLLLPFFVFGISGRAKEISLKMDRILAVLEKGTVLEDKQTKQTVALDQGLLDTLQRLEDKD